MPCCSWATRSMPGRAPIESAVVQAVCSPIRNPLDRDERRGLRAALSRTAAAVARLLARSAGVRPAALRWEFAGKATFENQIATLHLTGRDAHQTGPAQRRRRAVRGSAPNTAPPTAPKAQWATSISPRRCLRGAFRSTARSPRALAPDGLRRSLFHQAELGREHPHPGHRHRAHRPAPGGVEHLAQT